MKAFDEILKLTTDKLAREKLDAASKAGTSAEGRPGRRDDEPEAGSIRTEYDDTDLPKDRGDDGEPGDSRELLNVWHGE